MPVRKDKQGGEKDMYISPFWCGVIATILSEVLLAIVAVMLSGKGKK